MPKLRYILRMAPCSGNPQLTIFEDALRQGLSSILNVSLPDDQWLQASLPVQNGGLEVRSSGMLASSAYLASAAATLPLQKAILANSCSTTLDPAVSKALAIWKTLPRAEEPVAPRKLLLKSMGQYYYIKNLRGSPEAMQKQYRQGETEAVLLMPETG